MKDNQLNSVKVAPQPSSSGSQVSAVVEEYNQKSAVVLDLLDDLYNRLSNVTTGTWAEPPEEEISKDYVSLAYCIKGLNTRLGVAIDKLEWINRNLEV